MSSPALADRYVECVQRQLAYIGLDPGPADGDLGPRTRAAAHAYRSYGGRGLNGIADLDRHSAVGWCREIGLANPGASSFWPSRRDLTVLAGDARGRLQRESLAREVHARAVRYFAVEHGLRLASSPTVVISADVGEVVDLTLQVIAARGYRVRGAAEAIRARCSDRKNGGYFAERDLIVFCLPANRATGKKWRTEFTDIATAIYIHEYTHQAQREFALDIHPRRISADTPPTGPAWLSEGVADYHMEQWRVGPGRETSSAWTDLYHDYQDARGYPTALSRFRSNRTMGSNESYFVARLAVRMLAMRSGPGALSAYLGALSTGSGPEAAFERAFGMKLADFEAAFEALRTDFVAISAFARGEGIAKS